MKKIKLAFAAMAVLALASCGSSDKAATEAATATATEQEVVTEEPAEAVIALADDNLLRPGAQVDQVTVLDFNAVWCVPCKKLTPSFHKAGEAYAGKAKFYAVDIDKNPETAAAFGVQSIPTVIILKPDGSMRTFTGLGDFVSEEQMKAELTPDQLNEIIYGNMSKLIDESL